MIAAIIQARMGSTRFPGKVMKEIDGAPLLKYQMERVGKAGLLDKVIVATSISSRDDVIENFCRANDIECFRGAEDDVLGRYYHCAKKYEADIIVRLTADCPLTDPDVVDAAIKFFIDKKADYVGNTVPPETRRYPDGSDVEIFSIKALVRAHKECRDAHDREHVTFYFWRYKNGFRAYRLDDCPDRADYRITVDYPEDFEVIKFIFKELKRRRIFGHLKDIIDIIDSNPEIKTKNSMYSFGMRWKK